MMKRIAVTAGLASVFLLPAATHADYVYRDAEGVKHYSNVCPDGVKCTLRTPKKRGQPPPPPTEPSDPTTPAPQSATLTWDAVTGAGGYRIYYGTAPGTYFQGAGAGEQVGNFTSYTVNGLVSATRYYFVVTAYNTSNVESAYSNEVFKDTP